MTIERAAAVDGIVGMSSEGRTEIAAAAAGMEAAGRGAGGRVAAAAVASVSATSRNLNKGG